MSQGAVSVRVEIDVADIVFNKDHLKKTLRQAGNETARRTRTLLRSSEPSGRWYRGGGGDTSGVRGGYKKGRYRASGPGQAPARVTGTLAKRVAVKLFRNGEGVEIRNKAFYALFLENGALGGRPGKKGRRGQRNARRTVHGKKIISAASSTRELAPRHFLTTALEESSGRHLDARIGAAVRGGIDFVRH